MADCDACHLGPHDVAISLTCNDCHTSTEVWQRGGLRHPPVALPGKHGETACFQCHQYPNFKGLNNVCTDCHVSGHTDWGDHDCAECHDPGGTWDMTASTWEGHVEHWDQYKGQHLKVTCAGCHFEGYRPRSQLHDLPHGTREPRRRAGRGSTAQPATRRTSRGRNRDQTGEALISIEAERETHEQNKEVAEYHGAGSRDSAACSWQPWSLTGCAPSRRPSPPWSRRPPLYPPPPTDIPASAAGTDAGGPGFSACRLPRIRSRWSRWTTRTAWIATPTRRR